jgi:hypothetical protein
VALGETVQALARDKFLCDLPLELDAGGVAMPGICPVGRLERQVLEAPLAGVVLRYGRLNGPGIIQGLTDGV